jgi:hypothetical protein
MLTHAKFQIVRAGWEIQFRESMVQRGEEDSHNLKVFSHLRAGENVTVRLTLRWPQSFVPVTVIYK